MKKTKNHALPPPVDCLPPSELLTLIAPAYSPRIECIKQLITEPPKHGEKIHDR